MVAYLKSMSKWKWLLLIPYVYFMFVAFRGLYGANVMLQLQERVGEDEWVIPDEVMLSPILPQPDVLVRQTGAEVGMSDVLMRGAVFGAFWLFVWSIVIIVSNLKVRHYVKRPWVYLVVSVLFVLSHGYLFIKMSYTSVAFALSTETMQPSLFVRPLSLAYETYVATQSFTLVFAAIIVSILLSIRFLLTGNDPKIFMTSEERYENRRRIENDMIRQDRLEQIQYNRKRRGQGR